MYICIIYIYIYIYIYKYITYGNSDINYIKKEK